MTHPAEFVPVSLVLEDDTEAAALVAALGIAVHATTKTLLEGQVPQEQVMAALDVVGVAGSAADVIAQALPEEEGLTAILHQIEADAQSLTPIYFQALLGGAVLVLFDDDEDSEGNEEADEDADEVAFFTVEIDEDGNMDLDAALAAILADANGATEATDEDQ